MADEKALRLAREIRAAIRRRDEDPDLRAAIEVYDRAVSEEEREAAANYLLLHSVTTDQAYREAHNLGTLRAFMPELLPPELR